MNGNCSMQHMSKAGILKSMAMSFHKHLSTKHTMCMPIIFLNSLSHMEIDWTFHDAFVGMPILIYTIPPGSFNWDLWQRKAGLVMNDVLDVACHFIMLHCPGIKVHSTIMPYSRQSSDRTSYGMVYFLQPPPA